MEEQSDWIEGKAYIINDYYNADFYAVTLEKKSDSNVLVKCYYLDASFTHEDIDSLIDNGTVIKYGQDYDFDNLGSPDTKVSLFSEDLIFGIDVLAKYYFPTFTNNENQWYHKTGDNETCSIDFLHFIMKFAYSASINTIKIV